MKITDFKSLKEGDIVYLVKGHYTSFPNYSVEVKKVTIYAIDLNEKAIRYFDKHLYRDELAMWHADIRYIHKSLERARTAAVKLLNRSHSSIKRQIEKLREQEDHLKSEFKKLRQLKSQDLVVFNPNK